MIGDIIYLVVIGILMLSCLIGFVLWITGEFEPGASWWIPILIMFGFWIICILNVCDIDINLWIFKFSYYYSLTYLIILSSLFGSFIYCYLVFILLDFDLDDLLGDSIFWYVVFSISLIGVFAMLIIGITSITNIEWPKIPFSGSIAMLVIALTLLVSVPTFLAIDNFVYDLRMKKLRIEAEEKERKELKQDYYSIYLDQNTNISEKVLINCLNMFYSQNKINCKVKNLKQLADNEYLIIEGEMSKKEFDFYANSLNDLGIEYKAYINYIN